MGSNGFGDCEHPTMRYGRALSHNVGKVAESIFGSIGSITFVLLETVSFFDRRISKEEKDELTDGCFVLYCKVVVS